MKHRQGIYHKTLLKCVHKTIYYTIYSIKHVQNVMQNMPSLRTHSAFQFQFARPTSCQIMLDARVPSSRSYSVCCLKLLQSSSLIKFTYTSLPPPTAEWISQISRWTWIQYPHTILAICPESKRVIGKPMSQWVEPWLAQFGHGNQTGNTWDAAQPEPRPRKLFQHVITIISRCLC